MTDGVTDVIFWIYGTRMPWFNTWLGLEKKSIHLIYVIYIFYVIYIVYIKLHILYIAYICRVKSEWYINRSSFTTYMVEPT